MIQTSLHQQQQQSGAALIVGLVLLLVLTILAVSTMSTSSLEITMAGNNQFAENAFQLAEAGNASVNRRIATGNIIPVTDQGMNPVDDAVAVAALDGTYGTRFAWAGRTGLVEEFSTDFCQYVWVTTSTGTSSRQSRAVHQQGFWIIGAPAGCAGE